MGHTNVNLKTEDARKRTHQKKLVLTSAKKLELKKFGFNVSQKVRAQEIWF